MNRPHRQIAVLAGLLALALVSSACSATPTPTPTPVPPSPASTPTASPYVSFGPFAALPANCVDEFNFATTYDRAATLSDLATTSWTEANGTSYDTITFTFAGSLPKFGTIDRAWPPITSEPAQSPSPEAGAGLYYIRFDGASLYTTDHRLLYDGPPGLQPALPHVRQIVLTSDSDSGADLAFAVETEGTNCLYADLQHLPDRLVVAFYKGD
jgi:hypothetical protein